MLVQPALGTEISFFFSVCVTLFAFVLQASLQQFQEPLAFCLLLCLFSA